MRKLYKVGSITFALGVLGTAMVHAGITACASQEPAVKSGAAPSPSGNSPGSSAETHDVEYFPATKSGGFMPRKHHDQQQAKGK